MKKFKWIILTALVISAVGVLVACGTRDNNDNNNDNPSTGELNVGDQLEVDGVVYTVAENGDIVDDKGNVFKEAKDVAEWLKSMDVKGEGEDSTLTLASIQEAVGIKVTDENGKLQNKIVDRIKEVYNDFRNAISDEKADAHIREFEFAYYFDTNH